jgi:16S rRNA (cytosine967-C5)-methyltransferase
MANASRRSDSPEARSSFRLSRIGPFPDLTSDPSQKRLEHAIPDSTTATEPSARDEAVQRLLRIEEEGAYLGHGEHRLSDARAERQAREYTAGVTRRRRWLDFLMAHFYQGDFDAMDAPLRQILRVGLYDLLLLSTPPHAAVNEAVEAARRRVNPGAAGLANALLRNVQRHRDALPQPATGDVARDLAIRCSHPTWMVRRWVERFGWDEAEALMEAHNRRPAHGLRPNRLRMTPAAFREALDEWGLEWEPSPWLDDFVRVTRLQPLVRAGALAEGRCAVQDESAGLAVRLLDPRPGETVVDGCAAPGGKTTYAAALMQGDGRIFAFDRHDGRLDRLRKAARAQGIADMLTAETADLCAVADRSGNAPRADAVLLDAPCSGLGVLARRADLRWRRAPDDLDEMAALQDDLLDAAARLVRPGGRLVYSTCTTEPEENEDRVRAFLQRRADFHLEPADDLPVPVCTPDGFMATVPHRHGTDGAFAARLRRNEA